MNEARNTLKSRYSTTTKLNQVLNVQKMTPYSAVHPKSRVHQKVSIFVSTTNFVVVCLLLLAKKQVFDKRTPKIRVYE